jgi:hypothetical protein
MIMIMIISPKCIYANVSDSFVNNNNISYNGINNIFMINTTTDTFNNSNNSSETCKMPDCPKGQTCAQVYPESLPPPI